MGISQRAVIASTTSDLDNNSKAIKLYQVDNFGYPTSNDCTTTPAANSICLKTSQGTTVTAFTQNNTTNPQTFCISVVNGSNTYYINQDSTPQSGGCTITNYVPNPNYDTNSTGAGGPDGSTVARDTSKFVGETASLLVTMPTGTAGIVGASLYTGTNIVPATIKPNTTYTVSAYVYVPSATGDIQITMQGAGIATKLNPSTYTTSVKYSWVRISNSFITSSSGTITLYVLNKLANSTSGAQFWIDDAMLTEGNTLLNYGDGNSAGWSWSGTTNGSVSSGPQL